jgi:hypothetical protein
VVYNDASSSFSTAYMILKDDRMIRFDFSEG